MQCNPAISHPRGTVFYHLMSYLSSKSCPIYILWKTSEIIENMKFSWIFVLREIWYFRWLWKLKKIWYLRWESIHAVAFLQWNKNENCNQRPFVFLQKNTEFWKLYPNVYSYFPQVNTKSIYYQFSFVS